jgi:FkbM family methyltransferase
MSNFWSKTGALMTQTGLRGTMAYHCKEKLWRIARRLWPATPRDFVYKFYSRFSPGPVFVRAGTSDRYVFRQVLVNLEYDCLRQTHSPKLIVDCGANVGYASIFFLGKYPAAHVIAIEPEPGNFAQLKRNTAPFGARITAIQSGIWPHPTGLTIRRGQFGDGRDYATQVVETPSGQTPDIQAVDMAGVLAASGFSRIDILKVDIECAESALFGSHTERWLDQVDNLVIELHGVECERILFEAVRGKNYTLSRHGETTVLEGLCPKTSAP